MNTSRLTLSAVTALAALGALVAAGCGGSDDVPPDAVAIVDGTVITKASLEDLLGRAKKSYAADKRAFPKAGTPEFTSLQAQAVTYLVQREEYAKEAEALDIAVTDEQIDDRVAEIAKQYFNGDQAKLTAQLKAQGFTQEAFREDVEAQLVSEQIYEKLVAAVEVTDADVKEYYEAHKSEYTSAAINFAKSLAEARSVLRRLDAGEDFADLARKLSQDPGSKQAGGNLTIQRGQTVPAFDRSAFSLDVDEVSAPIKTQFGYHVIQALGPVKGDSREVRHILLAAKGAPAVTPLASVKAQIEAQLLEERKSTAVQEWSDGLSDEYKGKITYGTGYEPPAVETDDSSTETTG